MVRPAWLAGNGLGPALAAGAVVGAVVAAAGFVAGALVGATGAAAGFVAGAVVGAMVGAAGAALAGLWHALQVASVRPA